MAYDGNELTRQIAKDAFNLLTVENNLMLSVGLYDWTGMDDAIYAQVQANPDQAAHLGLTAGELYNAIVAIQALTAMLDANDKLHRQSLARIVKARNS